MPLTKRLFELGVGPQTEAWMRRIYDFLSADREHAYSRAELYEKFVEGMGLEDHRFPLVLDALEGVGGVEAREVRGTRYYAFYREVDQISWEPK